MRARKTWGGGYNQTHFLIPLSFAPLTHSTLSTVTLKKKCMGFIFDHISFTIYGILWFTLFFKVNEPLQTGRRCFILFSSTIFQLNCLLKATAKGVSSLQAMVKHSLPQAALKDCSLRWRTASNMYFLCLGQIGWYTCCVTRLYTYCMFAFFKNVQWVLSFHRFETYGFDLTSRSASLRSITLQERGRTWGRNTLIRELLKGSIELQPLSGQLFSMELS